VTVGIVGGRGTGKTVFVSLLATTAINYAVETKEHFRYYTSPEPKPSFEEIWRLTGGNPYTFSQLYAISWRIDKTIDTLIDEKSISPSLINKWRE
jgi:uridine kinase